MRLTTQLLLWVVAVVWNAVSAAVPLVLFSDMAKEVAPWMWAFMAFPAIGLLILGIASVAYWYYTESLGEGDLRAYALVQFLPMVLIPLMLALFQGRGLRAGLLWATLVTYALAKAAEHLDGPILDALQLVSGHSVKHVLAGVAVSFCIVAMHRAGKT